MQRAITLFIAGVGIVLLWVHAWWYLPYLADDALISLQYAKRLLAGDGLTWTDGVPVEGYSNLLWLLAAAGLGSFGIDLIDSVRVLGFLSMGAAMAAVAYAYRPSRTQSLAAPLMGLICIALSGPIAAWTVGGLEQPFVAAFLAWAVVLFYPQLKSNRKGWHGMLLPGLFLGLLCLTRPDGVIFTAAMLPAIALLKVGRKCKIKMVLALTALPLLFVVGQTLFRISYYGEWLPNTAHIKLGFSQHYLELGWRYLARGLASHSPMILLAAAALLVNIRTLFHATRMAVLCSLCATWLVYVVLIGGDVNPPSRHLVPVILLLGFMVAEYFEWLAKANRKLRIEIWIVTPFLLLLYVLFQLIDVENRDARDKMSAWLQDRATGLFLKQAFHQQQPVIAVVQAGWPPYWSDLPAIDMLGLNDYHIARTPPTGVRSGWIGHEFGDSDYILKRKPDLVVLCDSKGSAKGCFPAGKQLVADKRFHEQYGLVRLDPQHPLVPLLRIWVRKEESKIGIQRSPEQIQIPAYLFTAEPKNTAVLDTDNHLEVKLEPEESLQLTNMPLPKGSWEATAMPDDLHIEVAAPRKWKRRGKAPLRLWLRSPATVNITVRTQKQSAQFAELILRAVK